MNSDRFYCVPHVQRLRVSGFLLLMFERLIVAAWRVGIWALLFAALWLFEIPVIFGVVGQSAALLIFVVGILYLLWRDGRELCLPTLVEIDRRIERDSAVRNRPLSGLHDRLANNEKAGTRSLWALAQARLLAALPALKPIKLKAFMAARDPYALRLLVVMAFVVGLITAGPDWDGRIARGLSPLSFGQDAAAKRDHFTIWITPPKYTARPQLILNEQTIKDETLRIAQGSTIKAIVHGGFWGGWSIPRLSIADQVFDLKDGGDRSFGVDVAMPKGPRFHKDSLVLKQGFKTLASWPYEIIADAPPSLEIIGEGPEEFENASLRFAVSVFDDYGVEYLDMRMRLGDIVSDAPLGEPVVMRRSIASPAAQDFEISPVYDLSAHSWAGLPVVFAFTAVDQNGQESEIVTQNLILPERVFQHPVAKTLIALRKKLAWQPAAMAVYAEIAYDLDVLLSAKEMLHNDVVAYLGIKTAGARLNYNAPSIQIAREVMALLWDTALRIEDGDLSLSARRLRDAQMALEDALQNPDLSEEEIAQRMQDLRQAMAEYFNELAREMQKRAESGQQFMQIPPEMMAQALNPDALRDFLDQLEQNLRDGDTGSAQEMLSQMQRLMDMMNPSMAGQMPPDMQMMQEGINELEELIERQEELLAQTQGQAKMMEMLDAVGLGYGRILPRNKDLMKEWGLEDLPPVPELKTDKALPFIHTPHNQVEQEALRIVLGQLMLDADQAIGEIPPGMGLAEVEMRGSSEALELNRPDESVPHQEQAIAYLKQAQEDLAEQLAQRMQQMTGFALSFGGSGGAMQYDPLGRPLGREGESGEPGTGSRVTIPDKAERRRVQEILNLLRRRAGELGRPREEIEYYRRLLKRF